VSEQSWKPVFRTPDSTVTKVLRSNAFRHAREKSASVIEDAAQLHALADEVEILDQTASPLSAVADHVAATVGFLRATAASLERPAAHPEPSTTIAAGTATRHRLLVAALLYLVERDDLVPDFRAGGYVDDVLALAWVFGAASNELAPYLEDTS
jgi:hypothetical protein